MDYKKKEDAIEVASIIQEIYKSNVRFLENESMTRKDICMLAAGLTQSVAAILSSNDNREETSNTYNSCDMKFTGEKVIVENLEKMIVVDELQKQEGQEEQNQEDQEEKLSAPLDWPYDALEGAVVAHDNAILAGENLNVCIWTVFDLLSGHEWTDELTQLRIDFWSSLPDTQDLDDIIYRTLVILREKFDLCPHDKQKGYIVFTLEMLMDVYKNALEDNDSDQQRICKKLVLEFLRETEYSKGDQIRNLLDRYDFLEHNNEGSEEERASQMEEILEDIMFLLLSEQEQELEE